MSEEGEKTGLITVCPPSGERSYPRLLYLAEPLAPDRGIEPLRRSGSLLAPVLVREMPNYSRQSAIDEIPAFGTLARSAFTIIGAWGRSFRTSYAIRLRHYYGFCRNALARGVHGGMAKGAGFEPAQAFTLLPV